MALASCIVPATQPSDELASIALEAFAKMGEVDASTLKGPVRQDGVDIGGVHYDVPVWLFTAEVAAP